MSSRQAGRRRDTFSPDSSPDPLASSLNRTPSPRKPLRRIPQNPSNGWLNRSQFSGLSAKQSTAFEISPSKSMVMHTPSTSGSSPWKIKVTVEPHHESELSNQENTSLLSPSRRVSQRTITTNIPLKEPGESSPVKRRGRPRKSDVSDSTKPKRNRTPAKNLVRGSSSSHNEDEDAQHDVETESNVPKRRRGRPRKSLATEEASELFTSAGTDANRTDEAHNTGFSGLFSVADDPFLGDNGSQDAQHHGDVRGSLQSLETDINSNVHAVPQKRSPVKRGRGRPKKSEQITSSPDSFPKWSSNADVIASTTGATSFSNLTPLHMKYAEISDDTESPEYINPVRFRVPTPRRPAKRSENEFSPGESSDTRDRSEHGTGEQQRVTDETVTKTSNISENPIEAVDVDDTSILESEGFSMVSMDSLPSLRTSNTSALIQQTAPLDTTIMDTPHTSITTSKKTAQGATLTVPHISTTSTTGQASGPAPLIRTVSNHRTPSLEVQPPSKPPPIEVQTMHLSGASTPKLGRVVSAGIALQGVVKVDEGSTSAKRSPATIRSRLDDLFSGFGDGTRRELQAGLRLGEELARRSQERELSKECSPLPGSIPTFSITDDVFDPELSTSKNKPTPQRLPTPEEILDIQQHESTASSNLYSLSVPSQHNPTRSVEYPSLGKHFTPQVTTTVDTASEMDWKISTPPSTTSGESELENNFHAAPTTTEVPARKEDFNDIWEEEASGASMSDLPARDQSIIESQANPGEAMSSDVLTKPKRSKLPRTWRRKSSSDFNYSDEPEPVPEHEIQNFQNVQLPQSAVIDEDTGSDSISSPGNDDDDTGLFWQHNLPAVYHKAKSSQEPSKKLDLSEILGIHKSPLLSSPLRDEYRSSPTRAPQPILKYSIERSPSRQSPTVPSPSKRVAFADLTLEYSMDQSEMSMASCSEPSDIQQLRAEMESHNQHVVNSTESDGLGNIVPQLSSQSYQSSHMQRIDHSILNISPSKGPNSLFSDCISPAPVLRATSNDRTKATDSAQSGAPGLFARFAGGLRATFSGKAPTEPHPVVKNYPPVPYQHPWTRTHFISLDNLYQKHKRDSSTFSPEVHQHNADLLSSFPKYHKYVGAIYSNWGYDVQITEELLVMAKVFMQTMTVKDVAEYERVTGKKAKLGDCNGRNGKTGVRINEDDVVMRIFAVISGEMIREDERSGTEINREGRLTIEWSE